MIYAVLREDEVYTFLSKRARTCLEEQRNDFAWVRLAKPLIRVREDRAIKWWTFAGRSVNQWICDLSREFLAIHVSADDFRVRLETSLERIHELIDRLQVAPQATPTDELFVAKFSDLLPEAERTALLQCRAYRKSDLEKFIDNLQSEGDSPNKKP